MGMHDDRATWRHVGDMLAENPLLPDSHWWEFLRDTYATTQAVAVRRQAVPDVDSRNLATLLIELVDDCARVTEEFWVGLWVGHVNMRGMGRRKWAEQFGGDVGTYLVPAIVRGDIERLNEGSARVKRHVDISLTAQGRCGGRGRPSRCSRRHRRDRRGVSPLLQPVHREQHAATRADNRV